MLDNIALGTKIELQKRMDRFSVSSNTNGRYISQVLDYYEEELVCAMPIFEGKIIPLEINSEYIEGKATRANTSNNENHENSKSKK